MSESKELVNWEERFAERREARKEQIEFGSNRIRITQSGMFRTPDDREGKAIKVVVLDFMSVNLYYDSAYDRDNPKPPACFAIGPNPRTLVPSENSPAKQAEKCGICPLNEYGSALTGKGKACKNTRLLAVVPANAPEDDVWLLSIPPTSIRFWDKYVAQVSAEHGVDVAQVITSIHQDEKQTFAAPRFSVDGMIGVNELAAYGRRFEEARAALETEPNVEDYEPPKGKK